MMNEENDSVAGDARVHESSKARPWEWLLVGAAILLACGIELVWLGGRTPVALRSQLKHLHFGFLELAFAGFLVFTFANLGPILGLIFRNRRGVIGMILITLLAWSLVAWVAPPTNRIFYDEQIYMGIGQNLSDLQLAQMCGEGNVEYGILQCNRGEYNKQPYGYPYLLSVFYRVLGVDYDLGYLVNNLAAVLLAWVLFAIGTLIFEHHIAGLLAAVSVCTFPEGLRWSATAAAEPTAALFIAIAVLAAVWFCRDKSSLALAWLVSATALAAQFRPESILVFPLVGLTLAVYAPEEYRRPRTYWAAVIGLLLTSNLLAHIVAVSGERWGATGSRMSLQYFKHNLAVNGSFFLDNESFPAIISVLAVVGLVTATWRSRLVVGTYFLIFWGIFLFFYAGSYGYGADVRYSLMAYPPLALLAGSGAQQLSVALMRWMTQGRALALVIGAIVFSFQPFLPLVRSEGEEAWQARLDVKFARSLVEKIGPNGIVLTHNPSMFHVWGANAAQISIGLNEESYVRGHLKEKFQDGVFFHWNFWCTVSDPASVSTCQRLLNRYDHRLVAEQAVGTQKFALYELMLSESTQDIAAVAERVER